MYSFYALSSSKIHDFLFNMYNSLEENTFNIYYLSFTDVHIFV